MQHKVFKNVHLFIGDSEVTKFLKDKGRGRTVCIFKSLGHSWSSKFKNFKKFSHERKLVGILLNLGLLNFEALEYLKKLNTNESVTMVTEVGAKCFASLIFKLVVVCSISDIYMYQFGEIIEQYD